MTGSLSSDARLQAAGKTQQNHTSGEEKNAHPYGFQGQGWAFQVLGAVRLLAAAELKVT